MNSLNYKECSFFVYVHCDNLVGSFFHFASLKIRGNPSWNPFRIKVQYDVSLTIVENCFIPLIMLFEKKPKFTLISIQTKVPCFVYMKKRITDLPQCLEEWIFTDYINSMLNIQIYPILIHRERGNANKVPLFPLITF